MTLIPLILALVVVHGTLALKVAILYDPPSLRLSLPLTDRSIGAVIFHYSIGDRRYQPKARLTSSGWEHTIHDLAPDVAGIFHVYADVYDVNKTHIFTTDQTALTLDYTPYQARLPGRRIRGAAYFRDDFNSLSHSNWEIEVSMYGGWNNEFQVYTNDPKNVYIQGGNLYLRPTLTADDPRFGGNFLHTGTMDLRSLFGTCTNAAVNGCTRHGSDGILPPIMSGKVNSIPTMKYGIVEVRAKVPKGNWLWPAIWMLPKDSVYGSSPRSGEIDIMEYYDFLPRSVYTTLHWGPSGDQNGFEKTKGEVDAANWHDSFHTWRVEWTPDHIVVFLDNKQVVYVDPGSGGFWQYGGFSGTNIWRNGAKLAPFDQPFYFMLNVAVGCTCGAFPDGIDYGSTRKPWSNSSPRAAEDFWNARSQWLPSWQGDNVALVVDYVEFRNL
ncbi:hypothetical protein BsWGS_15816 [Bradybaena similaris]